MNKQAKPNIPDKMILRP